jgi:hypothetical protein
VTWGCQYVDAGRLADLGALHPTWIHGSLVQRSLSGVTRAERVPSLGRPSAAVLPEVTDDDVRRAARGAVRVLGGRRAPAAVAAEPGDRGPGLGLMRWHAAPRPADGPAGGLATGPDSADRVARCTTHGGQRMPQSASPNSRDAVSPAIQHNRAHHLLSQACL